jgi:hypothetical protein
MIEDVVSVVAVVALAVAAALVITMALANFSTPSVCRAAELVLQNPGSTLVVYGRFRVWSDNKSVYFSCGLVVERQRIVAVEKTEGVLIIESTPDGTLYIH